MISRGKFSWKEDWVFVVGGLLVLALLLLDGAVEASFEEKMLNEQIFDLELYLISTIISALANGIMVGLTIVVVAYFVFLVMCICSGRNGKCAWFFAGVDKLCAFLLTFRGKLAVVAGILGCVLIFPGEYIREYHIGDERVLPINAISYLIQDLGTEPEVVELETIENRGYVYTHSGPRRYGSSRTSMNKVYYTLYEWDGIVYETPATIYFYEQLDSADLLEEENVKVLIYPHTGLVVDFVEMPIGLYDTDEERINVCKERFGYPYLLSTDEMGRIEITQNPDVPHRLFEQYERMLEYEAFWMSYNGGEPYKCYLSSARTKDYIVMEADGTYEIQIGKENGILLSDCIIFEVENGRIKSINGEFADFEAYDPVKPAAENEPYSPEMEQFISVVSDAGYQVNTEMYHYILEDGGRYFRYKYVNAFCGSLQSSIQVYECETEDEAVLTYESWIGTYGTVPMEIEKQSVYALRGNTSEVDNGVLLRKGRFVYIFWDENVDEAIEVAEWFGCLKE